MYFPLQKKMRGYKVKQREWRTDDNESIRNKKCRDRKTKKTTCSDQRFPQREPKSSNNEKPEEEKETKKKKSTGVGRKKRAIHIVIPQPANYSLPYFISNSGFHFHFYSARTPAEFEKFHSRKRADGMLRELWQME